MAVWLGKGFSMFHKMPRVSAMTKLPVETKSRLIFLTVRTCLKLPRRYFCCCMAESTCASSLERSTVKGLAKTSANAIDASARQRDIAKNNFIHPKYSLFA